MEPVATAEHETANFLLHFLLTSLASMSGFCRSTEVVEALYRCDKVLLASVFHLYRHILLPHRLLLLFLYLRTYRLCFPLLHHFLLEIRMVLADLSRRLLEQPGGALHRHLPVAAQLEGKTAHSLILPLPGQ